MSSRCERTREWRSEWPSTLRVDFIVAQPTVRLAQGDCGALREYEGQEREWQKQGYSDIPASTECKAQG